MMPSSRYIEVFTIMSEVIRDAVWILMIPGIDITGNKIYSTHRTPLIDLQFFKSLAQKHLVCHST